jgi:DNA-binding MarR family transcriptional regulator
MQRSNVTRRTLRTSTPNLTRGQRKVDPGEQALHGSEIDSDDALSAMDSLRRIVRVLRVFSHTTQTRFSISGAQLYVLQSLEHEPGMSLTALAQRTLTHQSSVSVVVSRLVDAGFVKRRTSEEDARRSRLELTARGRTLVRGAPQAVQARLVQGLRELPERELSTIARALKRLTADMSDGEAPMFFEPERPEAEREKREKRDKRNNGRKRSQRVRA